MARHRHPLRTLAPAVVLGAVTVGLLLTASPPAFPDDTDLLRFNTAKPYVFIMLDTSGSMAQTTTGQWVHANGDDPRSKLYQAKKVLYEVMSEVDDVHFGFVGMDQDEVQPATKHWLYYAETGAPGNWPIQYPTPDPDGPIQVDPVTLQDLDDVEGDMLTMGPHFGGQAVAVAGTCLAPLPLGAVESSQREKVNRFAKLGVLGADTTTLWISASGETYRLQVERKNTRPDGSANAELGDDHLHVLFRLEQVATCGNDPAGNDTVFTGNLPEHHVKLRLWTDFLIADAPNAPEPIPGPWDFRDLTLASTCGSPHPFSGLGWEGNYDGAGFPDPNDPFCNPPGLPANCFNLKRTTVPHPLYPTEKALDRGDLLPFDWDEDNKTQFLARLAPGTKDDGSPDYGIASYFTDPPASPLTDTLLLENELERPLVAGGLTPLGKSVADFRCWYLGEGNKCKDSAYDERGWEEVALERDAAFTCRRPYLIVLSDGDDNCPGENPCADTANLNSKGDIRTWVIAYGKNCSQTGPPLKCMAQNGKGELVCPQDPQSLKDELLRILGEIREEARSFSSAAVPSVQAIADQTIFLTDFIPLNNAPVWDGHVKSFLKPLPVDPLTKRPRTDDEVKCLGKPVDELSKCFLWDAGVEIQKQLDGVGDGATQRRVFYAQAGTGGQVPATRQLFRSTAVTPPPVPGLAVRYDFWTGLRIPFSPDPDTGEDPVAEARANTVVARTYALKNDTVTVVDPRTGARTEKPITFLLGDVFHSNPLIVGAPSNTRFFAGDVAGYRDFATRHAKRRKLLFVGSNEGMLHAFDAGIYRASATNDPFTGKEVDDAYDNGTGREVFAFIPRFVLPQVREYAEGGLRDWAVDGTVSVSDVFIDPLHDGTPTRAEREWRTALVAGLREGGTGTEPPHTGYYALDITQPDTLSGEPDFVPKPNEGYIPSCLGLADDAPANCGTVRSFPAVLWEFDDTVVDQNGARVPLDEDPENLDSDPELESTGPDLGATWSAPNIGRIRLTEAGEVVDKYVAIFGGGFDFTDRITPKRGRWLYMVDIETGQTIYKRRLDAPTPSEPAAVDTNQDGYLDRIYIGTLAGTMYRVDIPDSPVPELTLQQARDGNGQMHDVLRVPTDVWVPRAIFKTSSPASGALPAIAGRPIYFRPSVIFVAELGAYALSFGTGNRESLWNKENQDGRFYVFVDESDDPSIQPSDLPFTESRLLPVAAGAPPLSDTDPNARALLDRAVGNKGWFLALDVEERVITDPFALSGVSFFSTFKPVTCQGTIDPITGECQETRDKLCSRGGRSRVFVINTVNANPFMRDASNLPTRFFEVSTYVTNPYTEQGTSKNPFSGSPTDDADQLTAQLTQVMEELKKLFPSNCKFANYRVDIKTISADTGVVFIAPVPVCIVEKNWREF